MNTCYGSYETLAASYPLAGAADSQVVWAKKTADMKNRSLNLSLLHV